MPRLAPEIACLLIVLIILGTMGAAWAIRNWHIDRNDEDYRP